RLRPGGPLAAPEGQRRYPLPERRGVEREILEPERGALPHRRELRGLEVGIGERRKPTMPEGERPESGEDRHHPPEENAHRITQDDEIGVIRDVRAGSPEMDEGTGRGR